MKTVQEDISTLKGRTIEIEKTVKDMDDGLNFMNSGVENLKCKVESTEPRDKIPQGTTTLSGGVKSTRKPAFYWNSRE